MGIKRVRIVVSFSVDSEGTKTDEKYVLKSSAFSAGVLAVHLCKKLPRYIVLSGVE